MLEGLNTLLVVKLSALARADVKRYTNSEGRIEGPGPGAEAVVR